VNNISSQEARRFSEEIIQDCLLIMESGSVEELFEIIPRLGVLRDPRSYPSDHHAGSSRRQALRVCRICDGSMGNQEFLDYLKKAFLKAQK